MPIRRACIATMNAYLRARKGVLAYVPWLAIFCFVLVSIGMIVWAVGTNKAFTSTNILLGIVSEGLMPLIMCLFDHATPHPVWN
jgi:hypothetical protein